MNCNACGVARSIIWSTKPIKNPSRHVCIGARNAKAREFQLHTRKTTRHIATSSVLSLAANPDKPKRGPKKSTLKLKDLPQGLVGSQDVLEESTAESEPSVMYPTVIQQARNNMTKFPDCVVLTRVGGFYELYFHQAQHWGMQLNIKVASRKTSAGTVPMAGFPFYQLERYLKVLVQEHGVPVAIAEEIANDPSQKIKSGGLQFDRQVRRIVTQGTLINEEFLKPNEHNYLLGITQGFHMDDTQSMRNGAVPDETGQVYLAWIDISSGDFFTQDAPAASLSSILSRIAPGEIVADQHLRDSPSPALKNALSEGGKKVTFFESSTSSDRYSNIASMVEGADLSSLKQVLSEQEISCAEMLLSYVREQLQDLRLRLQPPKKYKANEHMSIDRNTLRGLEILRTLKDGSFPGSLLHAIRRTSTRSGARLLSERLIAPSLSLPIIEVRLNLVQCFHKTPDLLEQIVALLKRTTDSLRLVQSLACGKGGAQDLLSLARTVNLTRRIGDILRSFADQNAPLQSLLDRFQWHKPDELASRILNAIDEDGLMARYRSQEDDAAEAAGLARAAIAAEEAADMAALHKRLSANRLTKHVSEGYEQNEDDSSSADEIWIMRRNASALLESLHSHLETLRQEKRELALKLQQEWNAKSLSLKYTPGLGHFVHVKGKDTKFDPSSVSKEARPLSSTKSTRSFSVPAWTTLGSRIEDAKLRIRGEEQQIFKSLREDVCTNIVALRSNANILDELDVACCSATLAIESNLVRPVFDESTSMHIVDGRHMTVEAGLRSQGRSFTPNDCQIGVPTTVKTSSLTPSNQLTNAKSQTPLAEAIHLITGPNMAGKSTYLRQTAIITILAQTGMYVPASYARLGLVDACFSRIGSADNLYKDQSTFMVEMLETADILRNAGNRSFVVMDEVGRGTSPEDGVAIGYAILEKLRREGVGRVMFATHFHKILDLCHDWTEAGCYCTRLVEEPAISASGTQNKMSFRFDHKMRRGINRDSHALKVARLAGIPADTVDVARDVLAHFKDVGEG